MNLQTNHARLSRPHSGLAGAFTLVELLVTVVIILVLAGLTFVVTGKVRGSAQQATAMSSLRQVGTASVNYSTENNGDINVMKWDGDSKEGGGKGWVSNTFWGRAQPYLFPDVSISDQRKLLDELRLRIKNLFGSTSSDPRNMDAGTFLQGARIYGDTSGLFVPLGFNSKLQKWNEFKKVSSFNDPSRVIYCTYGFTFITKEHGKVFTPIARDNSRPTNFIYYTDNREAITTFLDGHVELLKPPIQERLFE